MGSWHDRAPGETRVSLDYSGIVTFYDTSLSSLVEAWCGEDRLHLRLEGTSAVDPERVRAKLQVCFRASKTEGEASLAGWQSTSE